MSKDFVDKILYEATLKEVGELGGEYYVYREVGNDEESVVYLFQAEVGSINATFVNQHDISEQWPITKGKTVYVLDYSVNGVQDQFTKSNYKQLVKILTTVLMIVKEFVKEKNPDFLLFTGNYRPEEKDSKESIKSKLYGAIIDKHKSVLPNYKFSTNVLGGIKYYCLFK